VAAAAQLALATPLRRVAVVNVAAKSERGQPVIGALREALARDGAFAPVPTGPVAAALEGPLAPSPEAARDAAVQQADARVAEADDAVTRFDYERAVAELNAAEAALVDVRPEPPLVARLAEINFRRGVVAMAVSDSDAAIVAFRVVRRLAPDRAAPSAVLHKRAVVEAYRAAGLPQKKSATVAMRAPFDGAEVYLDGERVGTSPAIVTTEPGIHYAYVSLPGFVPGGRVVEIGRDGGSVNVPLRPLPSDARAHELRRELVGGDGPTDDALRAAAAEICDLSGAALVVFVADAGEGLRAAAYDRSTARLGPWRAVIADAGSADAVVAALPGRLDLALQRVPVPTADAGAPPPPPEPWWRRRWGIATLGGGAVVAALGAALVVMLGGGDVPPLDGGCCIGF
jgi:hypothetical protein